MKLKNSYLLIAIAIFLLISIGSVCASENITDNSDSSLADDGTDVVLSDTDGNVPDDTTQEKINTTTETDNTTYKFGYDSDKKFEVTVKDNKSTHIDVNKTDLSIVEGNKTINFDYNNSIITVKDLLSVGEHNLTVNYLGNANYTNSFTNITLRIFGNNTIETETSVVCNGKDVIIPVKVYDGVDYIELIKDNFNLTLVYINETGNVSNVNITDFTVEDGKIIFESPVNKLIAARVNITYTNATESKTVAIKVSTEVKAEKDEYKFKSEEIKNISITILDGQENQLNISKPDLKVFENGKEITNFKFNNSNITFELDIGVHDLTIIYIGNETYATSNTTITLKVWGNQTISPQESANIDSEGNVNITINLSDGADPVNVDLDNLTATLFWKIGNQTYNKTIEGINLADDNQTIIFKVTDKFESAYVDIAYKAENNLTGNTTLKMASGITAPDNIKYGAGEVMNFTIEVKSVNGTNLNVTSNNIKILNNGKEVKFTCNNSVITLTDKFTYGVYNLTINYIGTDTYADSTKIMALTVYGINATTSTNINSTKKGEIKVEVINGNETVTISPDDLILNVTYKDGNNTVKINITSKEIKNGTLIFTLENGNFTTATLNIKYNQTEANVTLNRIYNAEIIALNTVNEFKTGNFTFQLRDIDDGSNLTGKTIKLTTVGNIRAGFSATTDANGIATFKTINLYEFNNNGENGAISLSQIELDVGNHTVDIEKDNSDVVASKLTVNLTITQGHFNIVVNPYKEYYGTDKPVTVTVTNSKGEAVPGVIVKLTIDKLSGEYYLYTNTSGVGRISIYNTETKSGLVGGEYVFTVSNNDTVNIANTTAKGTVTVMKIPVVINGKDVTVYYNTGTTYTIKVTKDGKAVSGVYLLVRLYTTSSKYNDYLFQTNSKGQVSFSASLAVGKHKIIISSADNRYEAKQITKTITVKKASAKITAKKVNAYYKGGQYLTVKLTNTKNKKAIYDAKVNIKIYVSSNRYYNYNGNTGMNGKLKLLLDSLKPGTYKVVVSGADKKDFTAKEVTTKIVVKKAPAKLIAKKLTAKKGKNKYFKVTVKNKKTKKVIAKVKVKVKVYTGKKSKTYTLKTNSKGIAKLNVKKLKAGKHKVVITSANKYVTAKKAKSTIKIKK